MSNVLERFQQWYSDQCDGEWEHHHGITVGTLDNPGWQVEIDPGGTLLAEAAYPAFEREGTQADWCRCSKDGDRFVGFGGPGNLEEVLVQFLQWSEREELRSKGRRQ